MKRINVTLSAQGLRGAARELKEYKRWVEQKTKELTARLAKIGVMEASINFAGAAYDGINDAHVYLEPITNGWKIIASGRAVCFIEFGAGVYYNSPDPYPEARPAGIDGIGEYGLGRGKQTGWGYYDDMGQVSFTRGTPAEMPMFRAKEKMLAQIEKTIREVFGA